MEEVLWRHRIWPKENLEPKPSLDEIMSEPEIEIKVEHYLRRSELLRDCWHQPITPAALQAEMERMARRTKQPDVLRELFEALGNDPYLIAECLARAILAEERVNDLATGAEGNGIPFVRQISIDARDGDGATNLDNATYKLPQISVPLDCAENTWSATTTVGAPEERNHRNAVWTGSEMIIWGGTNSDGGHVNNLNTGGRYTPSTDRWTATTLNNAPLGRGGHSAVWTGREMIIWGGANYPVGQLNTGGRYNPMTESWTTTSTINAPIARVLHSAVWTGSEMIVWGGTVYNGSGRFNSGGRYDPTTDSWAATSTTDAPAARWDHKALWTGREMIIWGAPIRRTICTPAADTIPPPTVGRRRAWPTSRPGESRTRRSGLPVK